MSKKNTEIGLKEVSAEKGSPSQESLDVIDDVSPRIQPDEEHLQAWARTYVKGFRHRFAFDLDYAKRYFEPGSAILEVGSVPLAFTGALKQCGFRVMGVDLDPSRFEKTGLELGVEVRKCNIELEKQPFADEEFDGMVFNEVFEHLRIDPVFTVRELNRVLKHGGTMMLSTPNPHSFFGYVRFLFGRQTMFVAGSIFYEYGKLEKLGHMGHVREYGALEMIQFFQTMGFTVERMIYRGPRDCRWLPHRYRRFVSYVFRKTGLPQEAGTPEEHIPEVMGVRTWGLRLVAIPVVLGCYLVERLCHRWLGKKMGVPSDIV